MDELILLKKEIYDLPINLQKKLLTALTEGYELADEVNDEKYSSIEEKVFNLTEKEKNKIYNSLSYRLIDQPKETNNNSMRIVLSLLTKHMATKNISERQLEKEIDLTLSSIYAWRMGKAKPSIDALIKIANYFNVSLDYLVGRETPDSATLSQQSAANNVTTDPLLNRIVNLDELQRAKVEAYLDGLQATKTTSITRQLVSDAVNTKSETKQTNKNKSDQKLA